MPRDPPDEAVTLEEKLDFLSRGTGGKMKSDMTASFVLMSMSIRRTSLESSILE